MWAQDIAPDGHACGQYEALTPHWRLFAYAAYATAGNSVMVPNGCTQVTHTSELGQVGRFTLRLPVKNDRRHIKCRTASRAFWPSAWSLSQLLALSRLKKSSWSSNPSPSAKSRSTPVSTSKPSAVYRGQAGWPVPTHASASDRVSGLACRAEGRISRHRQACTRRLNRAVAPVISLETLAFEGLRAVAPRRDAAGAPC
ncbi:hypothetical protein SAMN05444398_101653 [Roseovarius pacificus]|uniref:Uncharacterized protein n=1 Tax=Roseovarius pacificus TaxID=337701 RepID=A0A1M6Y1E4_9RHOB|nr:hypothetical protein SAMN05444398_101653 [Roseovarius pacificus]